MQKIENISFYLQPLQNLVDTSKLMTNHDSFFGLRTITQMQLFIFSKPKKAY